MIGLVAGTVVGLVAGWVLGRQLLHRQVTALKDIVRHQEHQLDAHLTAWLVALRREDHDEAGPRAVRVPTRRRVRARTRRAASP